MIFFSTDVKLALPIQVAVCMPQRDRWLLLIRRRLLPQASQSIIKTECRRDGVQSFATTNCDLATGQLRSHGRLPRWHLSNTDTAQFSQCGSFLQALKRDATYSSSAIEGKKES